MKKIISLIIYSLVLIFGTIGLLKLYKYNSTRLTLTGIVTSGSNYSENYTVETVDGHIWGF